MQLATAITQEGEWFVARCLEIEVTSQGASSGEALANLTEAIELFFEGSAEQPEFSLGEPQVPDSIRACGPNEDAGD